MNSQGIKLVTIEGGIKKGMKSRMEFTSRDYIDSVGPRLSPRTKYCCPVLPIAS